MAIYRGPGGPGDATGDSANQAQVAETFSIQAGVSAAAAAASATTASDAATAAGVAQTAAEAAQTAAELAETNAETAETNAETAQTAAEAARDAALAAQTAAELAETNAETAETNAEAAQTAAEAAQLAAENAQTAAELAETNAETAETGAVAAQLAAESARDSALAAYDNFDDRYLGSKTSDPTLDNDGDALVAGALYFNSVDGAMRVYTGSVWVDAYAAGTSFLAKANNLSDLPNVATARTNLGLGTAATTDATDYLTDVVSDTSPQLGGDLNSNGNDILVADNDAIIIGSGSDLKITHSSSTNISTIETPSSSDILQIKQGASTVFQAASGNGSLFGGTSVRVKATDTGVELYNDVSIIDTGAIKIPVGTEAQRPGSPVAGQLRFNDDADEFEGYDGTEWGAIGGGGSGQMLGDAAVKAISYNAQTIAENLTVLSTYNALSVGPITIDSGYTVTVESGGRWVVI